MNRTVKLVIAGKVQGVFFRKATQKKANELGIMGTVRNTADGRVEVIAQGGGIVNLEPFVQWCHKGPLMAKVTEVEITELEPHAHNFKLFEIID